MTVGCRAFVGKIKDPETSGWLLIYCNKEGTKLPLDKPEVTLCPDHAFLIDTHKQQDVDRL